MEDSAATAALVGIVMALIELVKRLSGKSGNGNDSGSVDFRLKNLEDQNNNIYKKMDEMQSSFYEFREETRIRWAKSGDDE